LISYISVNLSANYFTIFHLQILAVLAAITEVIKTEDGKETDTEYFAALVCIDVEILINLKKNYYYKSPIR